MTATGERIAAIIEERFPGEVLIDDREARPGVKFADADLCGFPLQVILGERNLREDRVELKVRKTGERHLLPVSGLPEWIGDFLGRPGSMVDTLILDR